MCGITGIVGRPPDDPQVIERITELLRHRGPDDCGIWRSPHAHLGHRRLSILDVSTDGRQPMLLGDLALTYNGEIYNYRSLRRRFGGTYGSQTDSEVLLHAFRARGDACVEDLRGMFAFAVWDEKRRRLFAARDRLGIKPLYYRPFDGGLAFASEVGALLDLGPGLGIPELDDGALADYLTWGHVPTPKTPWRGIHKLGAGKSLVWEDGEVKIRRWWRPSDAGTDRDLEGAAAELDELLRLAVREHTISDVPVGVFLSGGLDSAAVTSYLRGAHTFTLGQHRSSRDEAPAARRVADMYDTVHREEVAEVADLVEALDTMVDTFGEPFGDSAALSVWLLSRMTARHVKVALSGEGGDEILCGYRWYGRDMRQTSGWMRRVLARLFPVLSLGGRSAGRRAATGLERYASFVALFAPWQTEALLGERLRAAAEEDLHWPVRRYWRRDLDLVRRIQWADLHGYLADTLLCKVDRASMAHSLEVRPPFLDHRVVDWALACPPRLKRDPQTDEGKRVLRHLMRERLPPGHLERSKRGFNLDVGSWSQRQPRLLRGALRRLRRARVLSRHPIVSLTHDQTWSLLVLDRWLAHHDRSYAS